MKAIEYTTYGPTDVLQMVETEKPTPQDNEVLVRICAAGANAADWRLMRGDPFFVRFESGLLKPKNKILGSDIAGVVEAVGSKVTHFKVGDEVFGDLSEDRLGGFAEYVCTHEAFLALKPKNLSFEEAAAVPMAAVTALQGLRDKGQIRPGMKVLINGASGGVGTYAVQIAKALGGEVTAVCSTKKIDLVRSIGADHVIDYTQENFTESSEKYDLIVAINGYHPLAAYKRILAPAGTYVCIGGEMKQIFQAMLLGPIMSKKGGVQLSSLLAKPKREDLDFVTELIETGKIMPVIDKRYSFPETAEAIGYIEAGHAMGKVVISVN
ncbi:MAG: NAD(P)-dependent alcohol dehydrogenase [Anaerolineae bacterium]